MENLGIDSKLLVAQLINFGLFFFVFRKYMAKPFLKFLDEEKNKDLEKEKIYASAKVMEEKLLEKEKLMKAEIKKDSEKFYTDAKKSAEKLKKDLLTDAQNEVVELKEKAKKQILEEREQVAKDAQSKVSELSLFIVDKVLEDMLVGETRKKVTDAIIKNSPKSVQFYEN